MLKNYLRIAWRTIKKHRVFSLINICGLALGIAAFWLIALYVVDEQSFDNYHANSERIFRVVQHGKWNTGKFDLAVTAAPFAPTLKTSYPQIENTVRIDAEGGGKIVAGGKKLDAQNMIFADATFFNVFSYSFLSGNENGALSDPSSIVITKSFAITLFGSPDALNKTILVDNAPCKITGVIDDVPSNSHFTFSAVRPFAANYSGTWVNSGIYTYVLLKNKNDYKNIEAGSTAFFNKYLKPVFGAMQYNLELQPLRSIHLHSHLSFELGNNGNITYVYVFTITAILILLLAVINYVNLTTARSSIRIKEIGVRKAIGSGRKQLMLMFFAESVLLTFLATFIAMAIIAFALPYFNQLSGKTLTIAPFGIAPTIVALTLFSLVTGILSGAYPALFLSSFDTISSLRGQLGSHLSNILFRKSLVVFQFAVTIVMITGSFIIYQQLQYVANRDLGFNKNQTLTFHINNQQVRGQVAAIKNRLLQNPHIESVGIAGNPIGNNNIGGGDFNLGPDGKISADSKMVEWLLVDPDFIPTLQIKMASGRNFFKSATADQKNAIIVNETLVKELGWTDAVGKSVRTGVDEEGRVIEQTIVGVVKDFNTYSLQHRIEPMVMSLPSGTNDQDNLYVRVSASGIPASLDFITKTFREFDQENTPDFHFLDQNFAAQYQSEQKQGTLLLIFTVLSISIACFGLFGLVTFTAEQKTKEIGVRKVLGASVGNITLMLSKDFIKLIFISLLIATPVAWYIMHRWLEDFAYRIAVSPFDFLIAGGIITFIAMATISFQSIKAATANPVNSLRSE